jgi:hypothetical protein
MPPVCGIVDAYYVFACQGDGPAGGDDRHPVWSRVVWERSYFEATAVTPCLVDGCRRT